MLNKTLITQEIETDELRQSVIETCFKEIDSFSLFPASNLEVGMEAARLANQKNLTLPFILTFCPAIENLNTPNSNGQTRKLVPLKRDLPRAKLAVAEILSFLISFKTKTGIKPHLFLIFADSLEKGAENMFVNADEMESITVESIKGIRELFNFSDQKHPGLLQSKQIEIPKVRRQTMINIEAGKAGMSRNQLIEEKEAQMFDPIDPLFNLWQKHLILTRNDGKFVSTGWQNRKGAESLWNRVRFILAEFIADGILLPEMLKVLNPKKFSAEIPRPIFLASSTRSGGFEMESDGFNVNQHTCVLAPFHNIGRWTEELKSSPWTDKELVL